MEHDNAAEWDLHRRHKETSARAATDDGWQTITKPDKGKGKATAAPLAPNGSTAKRPTQPGDSSSKQTLSQRRRPPGKWQDSRGRAPPPQQQRQAPRLIEYDENEGQSQWRAQHPPKLFVRIPTAVAIHDEKSEAQQLAREHLCFIASDHRPNANPESQSFGIWGSGEGPEKVRQAISKWVEELVGPQKSARSMRFAKLMSMTPTLRQRAERKWQRDVQRQRFRQHPPPGMLFGAIGTFHWPVKEYSPMEILGPNYEALDPIRMDCSCYLVWKKTGFQVMAKNMDKVKDALLRLKQTVFQIAAKQLPITRLYLLQWPHGTRSETVRLELYESPRQLSGVETAETKQHPTLRGEGNHYEQHGVSDTQSLASQRRMHAAVMRTISRLPHYRGTITMRLHFGRFVATQYMLPENGIYQLEEYESMAKESQFQARVTEELGDREMEEAALSTLRQANELLVPLGVASDFELSLSKVEPTYTAVFTFADRQGDLQLIRSWQPSIDDASGKPIFLLTSSKWSRLDRETQSASTLVDVCLTDLRNSSGWAFTIEAAQAIDYNRLDPALQNFADGVKIDEQTAMRKGTDKPFVKFNAYVPKTPLKSVEQRVVYTYALKDFDYSVELTRFQKVVYPEKKISSTVASAASQTRVFEPRWGLSVYRMDWDMMLAENEFLSIGSKASWDVNSERWFPKGWSGDDDLDTSRYFSNVFRALNELSDRLMEGGKVEDLLSGMTIG